jgi:hypothetical protein
MLSWFRKSLTYSKAGSIILLAKAVVNIAMVWAYHKQLSTTSTYLIPSHIWMYRKNRNGLIDKISYCSFFDKPTQSHYCIDTSKALRLRPNRYFKKCKYCHANPVLSKYQQIVLCFFSSLGICIFLPHFKPIPLFLPT